MSSSQSWPQQGVSPKVRKSPNLLRLWNEAFKNNIPCFLLSWPDLLLGLNFVQEGTETTYKADFKSLTTILRGQLVDTQACLQACSQSHWVLGLVSMKLCSHLPASANIPASLDFCEGENVFSSLYSNHFFPEGFPVNKNLMPGYGIRQIFPEIQSLLHLNWWAFAHVTLWYWSLSYGDHRAIRTEKWTWRCRGHELMILYKH